MNAQIVLENVEIRFPGRVLFEKVNWTLYEGMRVALAGRNGSGKSTLLRILAGETESTGGRRNIVGGKRLKIGYLDQTYLESAVLEAERLQDQTQTPTQLLISRLATPDEERSDEELEWQIKRTLSGLGFDKTKMESPFSHLSGGWLLRLFIAAALLKQPDVLLLDEPTNHLDLSSIQWLEEFLQDEYEGSLVLVTHDVALQKRTTNSLAILHGSQFYFRQHQKDYLSFGESMQEQKRLLDKKLETLGKKIKEQEKFIRTFGAKARMASRAQSKQKTIDKLQEEFDDAQEQLARVEGYSFNLRFNFRMGKAGSKFPLVADKVRFRYKEDGPWILQNIHLDIKRGQKVAIIGDNGAGKTTLLNVLSQRLEPSEGQIQFGHGVEVGYFGQHQLEELLLEDNLLDNLRAAAPGVPAEQLRTWLGAFGFCGNFEINKLARVLSGGEKARLALLRILCNPVNLILLDEPTNHLDVETKELLKNAFQSYEGTLIFISHDREFVESVAERIIYISNDHQLTDHIGDLNSFFEKYPEKVRHLEESHGKKKKVSQETDAPKESYEERKKRRNRINSLKKKVAEAEKLIEKAGEEKERLQALCDSEEFYKPENADKQKETFDKLAELEKAITKTMFDWEKYSTELEELGTD